MVELALPSDRDIDDVSSTPGSEAAEPTSVEADADATTLVPSPPSSDASFVVLSTTSTPTPGSPVTLPIAETATADDARPACAGAVLGRLLNPPPLRFAHLLETCAEGDIDDVDDIVNYLTSRHTVSYGTEVLRQLVTAIIETRRDTAERLLQQLAQLQSSDASIADTLRSITVTLQDMYSGETRP